MVNVSNNAMPWVYLAIYTIRCVYVLCACVGWAAVCNGKLPTISSLSTLGCVFASALLNSHLKDGIRLRFGSVGFGLFSFRY